MGRKFPGVECAVQVIPGLEKTVVEEVRLRTGREPKARVFHGGHRNSTVMLGGLWSGGELLRLRTAEDVFLVVGVVEEVAGGPRGLAAIERAVARPERLGMGVGLTRGGGGRLLRRRVPYRLVARDDGSADFSRHAIARHARKALEKLSRPRWEDVGEGAPVEMWLILCEGTFLCLLRITDRTFRHREYKAAHVPGSLRPTLAAAMVFLTEPKPADRFVDPLCGAGTVAIERSLWDGARQVIGGDSDSRALRACRENSAGLREPPDWVRWDAGRIPLPDYSVDKVATNLPFGEKHGAGADIPGLYREVSRETGRILRPGGKAIFLTSRKRTLQRSLDGKARLFVDRSIEVRILGKRAWMVVAVKR